jgi:hypothetical protein
MMVVVLARQSLAIDRLDTRMGRASTHIRKCHGCLLGHEVSLASLERNLGLILCRQRRCEQPTRTTPMNHIWRPRKAEKTARDRVAFTVRNIPIPSKAKSDKLRDEGSGTLGKPRSPWVLLPFT